jgi:hypothetical protein
LESHTGVIVGNTGKPLKLRWSLELSGF